LKNTRPRCCTTKRKAEPLLSPREQQRKPGRRLVVLGCHSRSVGERATWAAGCCWVGCSLRGALLAAGARERGRLRGPSGRLPVASGACANHSLRCVLRVCRWCRRSHCPAVQSALESHRPGPFLASPHGEPVSELYVRFIPEGSQMPSAYRTPMAALYYPVHPCRIASARRHS
jgi:hypothetical protein